MMQNIRFSENIFRTSDLHLLGFFFSITIKYIKFGLDLKIFWPSILHAKSTLYMLLGLILFIIAHTLYSSKLKICSRNLHYVKTRVFIF